MAQQFSLSRGTFDHTPAAGTYQGYQLMHVAMSRSLQEVEGVVVVDSLGLRSRASSSTRKEMR
jgi:hypothetical protein